MEELYKQCFNQYYEKLFCYAYTIVKSNEEAKDIVQSVFLKLWEKREEIDLAVSVKSYLYVSVYNLSLNTVRNRKIRESHHHEMKGQNWITNQNPLEARETQDRIKQAINALPPRCKEVFCKSRFEEKKYGEIAAELSISVKTVEVHMGKALKTLKAQLTDLLLLWLIMLPW